MANASGYFTHPSIPTLRSRIHVPIRVSGSGFYVSNRFSKRVLCSTSAPSMASINMLRHLLLNINDPAKVSLKVFKAQHGLLAEDRLRRLTNTKPGSAITSKLSF